MRLISIVLLMISLVGTTGCTDSGTFCRGKVITELIKKEGRRVTLRAKVEIENGCYEWGVGELSIVITPKQGGTYTLKGGGERMQLITVDTLRLGTLYDARAVAVLFVRNGRDTSFMKELYGNTITFMTDEFDISE